MARLKSFAQQFEVAQRVNAALKRRSFVRLNRFQEAFYDSLPLPDDAADPLTLPKRELERLRERCEIVFHGELPKILFVGTMEAQDRSGMLQSLKALGHDFSEFNKSDGSYGLEFPENMNDLGPRARNSNQLRLIWERSDEAFTLVIGQMLGLNVAPDLLSEIRNSGAIVVNISMDDRLPELWRLREDIGRAGAIGLAHAVDLTLTTCADMVRRYRKEGASAHFFPLASDPDIMFPRSERDIPISFVGNRYGERARLIDAVEQAGFTVTTYGAGWTNGPIDAAEAADVNGRSRIILGCGTVGHMRDIYTLKLRDFDALMAGGCYITHRNPDLLTVFEEGKHLLCYETADELVKQVRYCVQNPDFANRLAAEGRKKAASDYSWLSVFKRLFAQIGIPIADAQ